MKSFNEVLNKEWEALIFMVLTSKFKEEKDRTAWLEENNIKLGSTPIQMINLGKAHKVWEILKNGF